MPKTTTAINLGAGLVREGKKVLLIDFDAQGDLTTSLGFNKDNVDVTIKSLLEKTLNQVPINQSEGILKNSEGIDLIPANIELESLEMHLTSVINREYVLTKFINQVGMIMIIFLLIVSHLWVY